EQARNDVHSFRDEYVKSFRWMLLASVLVDFFFSSRRRHTRWPRDWSSDVCSSDLIGALARRRRGRRPAAYRRQQRAEQHYASHTHGPLLSSASADLRGHKCPSLRAGSSAPAPLLPPAPPATRLPASTLYPKEETWRSRLATRSRSI